MVMQSQQNFTSYQNPEQQLRRLRSSYPTTQNSTSEAWDWGEEKPFGNRHPVTEAQQMHQTLTKTSNPRIVWIPSGVRRPLQENFSIDKSEWWLKMHMKWWMDYKATKSGNSKQWQRTNVHSQDLKTVVAGTTENARRISYSGTVQPQEEEGLFLQWEKMTFHLCAFQGWTWGPLCPQSNEQAFCLLIELQTSRPPCYPLVLSFTCSAPISYSRSCIAHPRPKWLFQYQNSLHM